MHLTRFTDLSLRVLIYLTHNERKLDLQTSASAC